MSCVKSLEKRLRANIIEKRKSLEEEDFRSFIYNTCLKNNDLKLDFSFLKHLKWRSLLGKYFQKRL